MVIGEKFRCVGGTLLAIERIQMAGLASTIALASEAPKTRDGKSPSEAADAEIVGTNCWQDPERMLPIVEQLRTAVQAEDYGCGAWEALPGETFQAGACWSSRKSNGSRAHWSQNFYWTVTSRSRASRHV